MTCCHCQAVALYRVGRRGFCKQHRDMAISAATEAAKAHDSLGSASTGHDGNRPALGSVDVWRRFRHRNEAR